MMHTTQSLIRTLGAGLLAGLLLTACGGGGSGDGGLLDPGNGLVDGYDPGDGGNQPNPTNEPTEPSVRVVLAISGLGGSMDVQAGSLTQTIASGTSFAVFDTIPGTEVNVSITGMPAQQECRFSSNDQTTLTATASSGSIAIECDDLLTLTGTILAAGTENPVSGVDVTVSGFDASGNMTLERALTTGADGRYQFDRILLDDFSRMTITLDSEDHLLYALPINHMPSVLALEKNYSISTPENTSSFDATAAQTFTFDELEISLPGNSLVTAGGELPTGNVTVYATVLDPSFAAELLPGAYTRANGATPTALQNYGGVEIRFVAADGEELMYADGATATVRMPVALRERSSAPTDGAVHYFDRSSGHWVEAGSATMGTPGMYEFQVDQSTTWGVFEPYNTINVNGCVRDADGNPVADTLIITQGQNYIGRLVAYTNEYGSFSVRAKANAQVLLFARSDVASQTFVLSTQSSNMSRPCFVVDPETTTVTLSWGEAPTDVDSHLWGPDDSGGQFHIYYSSRTALVNGITMYLDVDDVTSYGPEVVTIPRFPLPGTYSYYLHNYSGSPSMYESPTRIALFTALVEYVYFIDEPEPTASDDCWHVFDIEVDSNLTPTVTEVGAWVNTSFCH